MSCRSSRLPRAAGLTLAAVTLVACGSGYATAPPVPVSELGSAAAVTGAASTRAATPSRAPARVVGAASVVKALGVTAELTVAYTAKTDVNGLLGRPGQYIGKAAFRDTRVAGADVTDSSPGSVELGGSVETFDNVADARRRAEYVVDVTAGTPALAEYDYLAGTTLLRISHLLTPDEVVPLVAALQRRTGASAELVRPKS